MGPVLSRPSAGRPTDDALQRCRRQRQRRERTADLAACALVLAAVAAVLLGLAPR